jgi:hypothetical protein
MGNDEDVPLVPPPPAMSASAIIAVDLVSKVVNCDGFLSVPLIFYFSSARMRLVRFAISGRILATSTCFFLL